MRFSIGLQDTQKSKAASPNMYVHGEDGEPDERLYRTRCDRYQSKRERGLAPGLAYNGDGEPAEPPHHGKRVGLNTRVGRRQGCRSSQARISS